MATTLTPNLSLPVPSIGTEPGPQYAVDINNCLTIIDGHDHSPGYGAPIGPAGMNINADLSFIGNNLTDLRSLRLSPQTASLSLPADLGCIYEVGVDLYYNDGAGNVVRITQSGGLAGTPGSIAGLTTPASASYGASTFTFQSDSLTSANLDCASVILRNLIASSPGLTLSPPSLSNDYTITFPTLPVSTLPVQIASSGAMTAAQITLTQLSAQVQALLAATTLPGVIQAYGGAAAPTGYLLCDGTAISRTTYSSLFTAIGTAYGVGDGTTTFNLPDGRGMFLRGVTGASSNDPDATSRTATNGGNAGNNVGSKQSFAFQDHVHSAYTYEGGSGAHQGYYHGPTNTINGGGAVTLGANTGTTSTETRPINVYVNYIIKT